MAAGLVACILVVSVGRWWMEGQPRKVWRGEAAWESPEYCPDGMCFQIRAFAAVLRDEPDAVGKYVAFLRQSHQSSSYLVGVLAAPLTLLGASPAVAFCTVSILATLLLVGLLVRVLLEVFPESPRWRLATLALFLVHPATVRCFARPQTDALLAACAFASLFLGRALARRDAGTGTALLLLAAQLGACFVKIHGLALLLVPPAVAWLAGARGRRLGLVLACGTLLPLAGWLVLFAVLDLFGTIPIAWNYLDQFYHSWTPGQVAKCVALAVLPLLAPALLHPRPLRPLPAALWLLVLGFGAILVACRLPPLSRFLFPGLAPLVLLCTSALHARFGDRRAVRVWLLATIAGLFLLSSTVVGFDLYGRYVGPTRDLAPLDHFIIHFF